MLLNLHEAMHSKGMDILFLVVLKSLKTPSFLTRKLAEKVYEECIEKWRPADKERGMIHDDDLVLWEYNNGYSKELRNYQNELS